MTSQQLPKVSGVATSDGEHAQDWVAGVSWGTVGSLSAAVTVASTRPVGVLGAESGLAGAGPSLFVSNFRTTKIWFKDLQGGW